MCLLQHVHLYSSAQQGRTVDAQDGLGKQALSAAIVTLQYRDSRSYITLAGVLQ